MRRIIATMAASGLLLGFAGMPAYAQDTNAGSGQAVAACNRTAKDSLKSVRDSFKAGSITEAERNTKVKEVETTRRSCVKSAREAAKTARDAKRAEMKAKKQTARDAKKSAKVTPTPAQ